MFKSVVVAVLLSINSTFLSLLPAVAATNQRTTLEEALKTFETSAVLPEVSIEPLVVPEVVNVHERALLETIAFAEGTWDSSVDAIVYDVAFSQRPGRGAAQNGASRGACH